MEAVAALPITVGVSPAAWLPLAAVLVPLAGAAAVALLRGKDTARNVLSVATCTLTLAIVAAMYGPVYLGMHLEGELHRGLSLTLPGLFASGLTFHVDATGLLVALLTASIYLLGVIFSTSYMREEHARARFDAFLLVALAGNLGVLLAGDFASLFVFFELMAIAGYVLVVHGQNPQSMRAGGLYLYMSVIGGLVLLGGIVALGAMTGSVAIAPAGEALAKLPRWLGLGIPLAMMVGFGTKAGLFLLHVWLPEAHPVAPSPASALLSALMVKVGVYGILRTANVVLMPGAEAGGELMHLAGIALIAAGVVTMVAGMVNASFCSNCKELLAFSTISQVGYIILGLGCAAYLGAEGAMGMTGALLHVVNHAVFKALLFLTVGAVIWRAQEQHFSRLGGMVHKMPWTAAASLLAMLSITGVPGTAGFASKSLLHHAVLEVIGHTAALQGSPDWRAVMVEALFVGVAAGTFAYSSRMFILVFLGRVPRHLRSVKPESWAMRLAYLPLMVAIVVGGLLPNWVLVRFVGPALASFGFDAASPVYRSIYDVATGASTIPILYDPRVLWSPITPVVSENLIAIASSVFFAGTFYLVGHKIGAFDMPVPEWFRLGDWYRRIGAWVIGRVAAAGRAVDDAVDRLVWAVFVVPWLATRQEIASRAPLVVPWLARVLGAVTAWVTSLEGVLDRALSLVFVDAWMTEAPTVAPSGGRLTRAFSLAAEADRLVDVGVTAAMVDVWLPSGPVSDKPADGTRRAGEAGVASRVPAAASRSDRLLDRILSAAMVDAWLSGSPVAEGTPTEEQLVRVRAQRAGSGTPGRPGRAARVWTIGRDTSFWWGMAWRVALLLIGVGVIWATVQIALGPQMGP